MTDKCESSFEVIRFNERTYQSGGIVAVITELRPRKELSMISIGVRAREIGGFLPWVCS